MIRSYLEWTSVFQLDNYENFPKGPGHQARGTQLSSVLKLLATEIPTTKKSQIESQDLLCEENGSIANEDTMTEPGEGLMRPLLSIKGYQKIVTAQRSVEYSWLTWRPVPEGPTI